jgi:tripartite ATP-independent transporter DctM subunit
MTPRTSVVVAARLRAHAATILAGLDKALEALVVVCLAGIFFDVLAGVVSRYAFNASFVWTEELGQLLFIYLIFLTLPLALRQGRHVAVGVLASRLGPAPRAVLDFLVSAVVAHTVVMLMVSGVDLVRLLGGTSPGLGWPTWVKNGVIPASCVAALVYLVCGEMAVRASLLLRLGACATGVASWWLVQVSEWMAIPQTSPSLVMAIAFFVTLAMGVPVAFSMLFSAFLANWGAALLPPPAVVQNLVTGSGKFLLLAIPLFLTAGHLMNAGALTQRLMNLAHALVGHLRGGLAQVNVMASVLFGGVSGSSSADVSVDSKILVPEMVKHGYSPAFSCAITAASGVLPNIIPPSIAMLLFASIAEVSVGRLFVAGIGAGLLIAFFLMVTVSIMAQARGYGRAGPRQPLIAIGSAFLSAVPVLSLAIMIVAGLRFGIVTATESGVIAVLWALILGQYWYRAFGWRDLYRLMASCGIDAGLVGLLIGAATPFAWIMTAERIPQELIERLLSVISSPAGILLLLNALMLIAGTFLDLTASMLILIPLFMPLMIQIGVDPVHFGIIVVVNLMLGGITPPVGLLVFVAGTITNTPVNAIFREVWPFLLAMIAALLVITYVQDVPMTLVRALY